MTDDQQFVRDLFYESSSELNYKIQCLEHNQLLYTFGMLDSIRREERPDLFTWVEGKGRAIDALPVDERNRLIKEIDDKTAAHDVLFDSYDPGEEVSPAGMNEIMRIYDEWFFDEWDDGLRELLYDDEFAKDVGTWFKCLVDEWKKFFITLRCGWMGGHGGYKAEYACKLLNDIFLERIKDIDHKVDVREYRKKVADFNYAMAEVAEYVCTTAHERSKITNEIIDSDPDDYYEVGRHVIADVYGEDENVAWRKEEFEQPGHLYYIKDSKDPHGFEGRSRVFEKQRIDSEKTKQQRVILAQVEKPAGRELYHSLHRGGKPRQTVRPAFTQKAVGILCGRTEDTVANWERTEGGTTPPSGYRKELRVNGGEEFFDFVTRFRRENDCKDSLRDYLKGNNKVKYLEGLTEREMGLVEKYIQGMKP